MKPTKKKSEEMQKRIKSFNRLGYNAKLQEGINTSSKAIALKEAITSFNGLNELELINDYLLKETNFKNLKMASDSLNLLDQYQTFKKLEGTVNLSNYNEDFSDWNSKYKEELEQYFTVYWSDEQTKIINDLENKLDQINKMSPLLRYSIFKNRENNFTFSDVQYSSHLGDEERAKRRLERK